MDMLGILCRCSSDEKSGIEPITNGLIIYRISHTKANPPTPPVLLQAVIQTHQALVHNGNGVLFILQTAARRQSPEYQQPPEALQREEM